MTDGSIKYVYSYQAFDMQMLVLKEWEIHWPADIPSEEKHRNLREKRDKHSLADALWILTTASSATTLSWGKYYVFKCNVLTIFKCQEWKKSEISKGYSWWIKNIHSTFYIYIYFSTLVITLHNPQDTTDKSQVKSHKVCLKDLLFRSMERHQLTHRR